MTDGLGWAGLGWAFWLAADLSCPLLGWFRVGAGAWAFGRALLLLFFSRKFSSLRLRLFEIATKIVFVVFVFSTLSSVLARASQPCDSFLFDRSLSRVVFAWCLLSLLREGRSRARYFRPFRPGLRVCTGVRLSSLLAGVTVRCFLYWTPPRWNGRCPCVPLSSFRL